MNPVQARILPDSSPRGARRPPLRHATRGLVLPAPVFRRWKGDRVRFLRWRRAWVVVVVLLAALPMLLLLPPVQRMAFPLKFRPDLVEASREAGVDPWLLAALVHHESGFRPRAVSEAGATGLTQLLPSTARWAADQSGIPLESEEDLGRPSTNLRLGAWYLGWLLQRFEGDRVLALAAYNGGQHTVDRWRGGSCRSLEVDQLPFPETRCFVESVLFTRDRYRRLYPDLARGPAGM